MFEHLADNLDVNIIQSEDYLSDILRLTVDGKILLVTSQSFSKRGIVASLINVLENERVIVFDQVTPNPEKMFVEISHGKFANEGITNILAIGGGSVIDTAKVYSAMFSYVNQSLEQLLNRNDLKCKVNLIAIPTTSGTGSEVTPFATVWDNKTSSKCSLYGIKPKVAILDPRLTLTLPYSETLYPALDALSHALESLWNKNKTQASQGLAKSAIELICESLPRVLSEPNDLTARKKLQYAATLAGLAISTTKTAIAHAISYPITLKYGVPHGLACSFTLINIINTFGSEKLNLTIETADKVKQLLRPLDLTSRLASFVELNTLANQLDVKLDPTRAGNFIVNFENLNFSQLLQGEKDCKAGEI